MRSVLVGMVLACTFAMSGAPQEAVVAELTKEEAVQARELYQRMVAAEADFSKFKTVIRDKYGPILAKEVPENRRIRIGSGPTNPPGTVVVTMPTDWYEGIEFTSNFLFAVPKPQRRQ